MIRFHGLRFLALLLPMLTHMGSPLRAGAASAPAFVEDGIGGTWKEAAGLVFSPTGQMFVWERPGRVYVVENGVKQTQPLLDITEEVGSWHDHGLMSMALDPNFMTNGYFYLLYVVDHYYLANYGTPSYNSSSNDYFRATIGRITRYTARASDNFHSIDPASRFILLGETPQTGFPILYTSHGMGSLVFGEDGTLFASCGDGGTQKTNDMGNASGNYYAQGIAEGIIQPKENVGSFRAQMTTTLAGKILRLDPATGDGIPSNPFYDAGQPRSARSRIWALGLRQPFRFTIRPGTGSRLREDGRPGVLYIGDVGWLTWEELDVCTGPGQNFGWPLFEGLEEQPLFTAGLTANQDAPNPLSGSGGCAQPFFHFQDLLKQATLGTVSWPNPCDPSQPIPNTINRFVHTRPVLDWKQPSGPSRTGIFSGTNAAVINVGATGSPVSGPQFAGNCGIGGVWYTNTQFPANYQNTYFHADYGAKWIKNIVFDQSNAPVAVSDFWTTSTGIMFLTAHPIDGSIYYVGWSNSVRRIRYVWGTNVIPTLGWANPAPITFGTPLGLAQLNATSSVAGTFVYTPPAGTVLNPGSNQVLAATFTPADTTTYTNASATVLIDVIAPPEPPAAVTNLAVTVVTPTSVSLTWTAPGASGYMGTASSYDLRYSTNVLTEANWASASQATGAPVPSSAGTPETFTIDGLASGVTYWFGLKASNAANNLSPLSDVPSATTTVAPSLPAAPAGLRATAVASNEIDLVWLDNADNEDGFKVERSTNGVDFIQIAATGPNVTNAADHAVQPGITDYYRVFAYNAAGNSPYSNTNSAQTFVNTGVPVVTISLNSGAQVMLVWNASPGKTYRVQYAAAPATNSWLTLGNDVVATGAVGSVTDTLGAIPQRFYRVLRMD